MLILSHKREQLGLRVKCFGRCHYLMHLKLMHSHQLYFRNFIEISPTLSMLGLYFNIQTNFKSNLNLYTCRKKTKSNSYKYNNYIYSNIKYIVNIDRLSYPINHESLSQVNFTTYYNNSFLNLRLQMKLPSINLFVLLIFLKKNHMQKKNKRSYTIYKINRYSAFYY